MDSLEQLQARARDLMKAPQVDLDELNWVKSLLMSIVLDTAAPESDRDRAARTVSELFDFKISIIITEAPGRLELLKQDQLARLGDRIDSMERKNSKVRS